MDRHHPRTNSPARPIRGIPSSGTLRARAWHARGPGTCNLRVPLRHPQLKIDQSFRGMKNRRSGILPYAETVDGDRHANAVLDRKPESKTAPDDRESGIASAAGQRTQMFAATLDSLAPVYKPCIPPSARNSSRGNIGHSPSPLVQSPGRSACPVRWTSR